MRVVVCVKPVPSAAASQRFDVAAGRADRSGPMEINAPDLYAVEEALRIRDLVGGEVVALAMTPESGFDSLRTPVAMGVDRAVAISDAALEGSDLVVTARVLAAAIALEAPSLVLFGAEAEDGGGAMLWAAVAERLRLPVVSSAHEVQAADGSIRVTCRRSDSVDTVEVPLPCVISISSSASTPRYPTLPNIMKAKQKELISLPAEGLFKEESLVTPEKLYRPEKKISGLVLEGSINELVDKLVAVLKEKTTLLR